MKYLSIEIIKTLTTVKYPKLIDAWYIDEIVSFELMSMNKIEINKNIILKALELSNKELKNEMNYVLEIKRTNLQIISKLYPKSIYLDDNFIKKVFNYIRYSYAIGFLKEISKEELFFDLNPLHMYNSSETNAKNMLKNVLNCRSYKLYKLEFYEWI